MEEINHHKMQMFSDGILVPLSIIFTIGYHGYLWHFLKYKPFLTSIGLNRIKRKRWLQEFNQQGLDEKKAMMVVQSLRNTKMGTILTSIITILIVLSMSALANNSFNSSHLFATNSSSSKIIIFGSENDVIIGLKYGSASVFLLGSFFCSSIALVSFIDSNFLINAENLSGCCSSFVRGDYNEFMMERGFGFSLVGNRLLCISFSLVAWLFGPLAVVLSSLGLVWVLYILDFGGVPLINKMLLEIQGC